MTTKARLDKLERRIRQRVPDARDLPADVLRRADDVIGWLLLAARPLLDLPDADAAAALAAEWMTPDDESHDVAAKWIARARRLTDAEWFTIEQRSGRWRHALRPAPPPRPVLALPPADAVEANVGPHNTTGESNHDNAPRCWWDADSQTWHWHASLD